MEDLDDLLTRRGRTREEYVAAVDAGRPVSTQEAGVWTVAIPGTPVAAEAATRDEAITEAVAAVRAYAAAWRDRLHDAPNHEGEWWVAVLAESSTDEDLAAWVTGDR